MGCSCRLVVLCVMTFWYICEGRISDKRLCGDPACSGMTSLYYCLDVSCFASCMLCMTRKYLKFIH
jgi:hypothetical protein